MPPPFPCRTFSGRSLLRPVRLFFPTRKAFIPHSLTAPASLPGSSSYPHSHTALRHSLPAAAGCVHSGRHRVQIIFQQSYPEKECVCPAGKNITVNRAAVTPTCHICLRTPKMQFTSRRMARAPFAALL